MTDRILEIIKVKGISASKFAEMIGVPRSSISHLISGRNKPSLDFLQKVLNRFTEINPEWLYTGSGKMMRNDQKGERLASQKPVEQDQGVEKSGDQKEPEIKEARKMARKRENPAEQKSIEKIMVFYTDRTFREYQPE